MKINFFRLLRRTRRRRIPVSSKYIGRVGERKTSFNLSISLDNKIYKRFHDIIIPSYNGTTQIDHLLISPFGLFIIETKNIKGWIFGSEDQARWTQTLYGKKYSFQNPLRQTYRQKKVLSDFLKIHDSKIHTIVFFPGNCRFMTELPYNVIDSGLARYIKQFQEPIVSPTEIDKIIERLNRHISESTITTRDHVESLRERHSSTTVCPNCGGNLIERLARRGPNSGSRFLGCSNYPKCKFTRNL